MRACLSPSFEAFEKAVAGLKLPLVEPDAEAFVAQLLRQRFARIGVFAGVTQKGVVLQVGDILS